MMKLKIILNIILGKPVCYKMKFYKNHYAIVDFGDPAKKCIVYKCEFYNEVYK